MLASIILILKERVWYKYDGVAESMMVITTHTIEEVKRFWSWFAKNHSQFGERFENKHLINELDQWVYRLGDFSWEIGPGIKEENALIISPNGSLERLEIAKKIVALAIPCKGWEFRYAKPAKQWNLTFEFYSNKKQNILIDANEWEYVLLKYPDEMFDIVIKVKGLDKLDQSDKLSIGEILLDGILGEEKRINTIANIEVVSEFDSSYSDKSSGIKTLNQHISQYLS